MCYRLPACLTYARDLTLISQVTEAQTADAILANISMWSSAELATVVLLHLELRCALSLEFH